MNYEAFLSRNKNKYKVLKRISSFYDGVYKYLIYKSLNLFIKKITYADRIGRSKKILNRFKISFALNLDNSCLYASFRLYNGNSF
jgi:hypothetical protein